MIEFFKKKEGTAMEDFHKHVLSDGSIVRHSHTHSHSHTQTKQVKNRLKNIIGHLEGVTNMVEEGRDCSEILIQLSAISSSVRKLKSIILKDHVEHCIVDAVQNGDEKTIKKLKDAMDKMME